MIFDQPQKNVFTIGSQLVVLLLTVNIILPPNLLMSRQTKQALLEAAALPSVFTLGKELFALGKDFAECSARQSPLGKIFLGKGSLPSAFYRGTRQNKK